LAGGRGARYGFRDPHRRPGEGDGAALRIGAGRGKHGAGTGRPARDRSLPGALNMLDVQAIDQYYGGSHTLRGESLSVRQGECLALLDRNGVDKTTLLKCLMGVLPVACGRNVLDAEDITRLAPHQRAARGMA